MRRLIACLAAGALLLSPSACGGRSAGPSVAVSAGPQLQTEGHEVYVFLLTPTGTPSGVVALKVVRDGRVQTLGRIHFSAMNDVGSAAVEVEGRSIVGFWTIPSRESASAESTATLPAHSASAATAWAGLTAAPARLDAEQVFWTQDRYTGAQPAAGGTLCGGPLADVVRASKETPAKTSYCLTIEVTAR